MLENFRDMARNSAKSKKNYIEQLSKIKKILFKKKNIN